jgi:hypothetical protein
MSKKLNQDDAKQPIMCCFKKMTITQLKNKLAKSWIEDTFENNQLYRKYLTKQQIDKVLNIIIENNK